MQFWGISWLTAAVVLGVCGAGLVVLHLLRIRSQPIRVVTCMFWDQALSQSRARTLPGRFRHPLTFALLLLICGLIVLSLTHPVLVGRTDKLSHRVLVLDAGCSMAARDEDGSSRLENAVDDISKLVSESGGGVRWAVLVADPKPRLVHGFEDSRSLLPVNLDLIEPASVAVAREDALHLAASLLNGKSDPGIVLFTDCEMATGEGEIPVTVAYVGEPVDNLACASAVFEAYSENPQQGQLSFRVGNWGRKAAQAVVRVVDEDGEALWQRILNFEPGWTSEFSIADMRADGRRLRILIECDDALKQDNELVFDLPHHVPVRVWADGVIANPLAIVLENAPSVELVSNRDQCDVAVLVDPAETPDGPVIIIHTKGQTEQAGGKIVFSENLNWPDVWLMESLVCGIGPYLDALPADALDLFSINDKVLAAFANDGGNWRLHLSSALLSEESTFWKRPLFAIVLNRAIGFLADGGQAGEERIRNLFVDHRDSNVFSTDSQRFDLSKTVAMTTLPADVIGAKGGAMLDLLQWIILLVLIAVAIECWLFVKGKIV